MKVTAQARRSGSWWAVEVPEVPGAFTQVRRLDQVADEAAAAVADLLEIDPSSIEVELDPLLDADAREVVDRALMMSVAAVRTQAIASATMRRAVAVLREDNGLTTRDTATLLEITHQRVAQLDGVAREKCANADRQLRDAPVIFAAMNPERDFEAPEPTLTVKVQGREYVVVGDEIVLVEHKTS